MKKYEFTVYSFHPAEYRDHFYRIFDEEKNKGNLVYRYRIEETAPPPDLVKDIIVVTAASLTIIKTLYDFYKEIKNNKGKVIIRTKGRDLDLEAYNIEELRIALSQDEEEK